MSVIKKTFAPSLLERIQQGEFILMDGALGTELERRGVSINETSWSANAVLNDGEMI